MVFVGGALELDFRREAFPGSGQPEIFECRCILGIIGRIHQPLLDGVPILGRDKFRKCPSSQGVLRIVMQGGKGVIVKDDPAIL